MNSVKNWRGFAKLGGPPERERQENCLVVLMTIQNNYSQIC